MWLYVLIGLVAVTLACFLWIRLKYEPRPVEHPAMTPGEPNAPQQRRQFTRVPLAVSAELRVADGRKVKGATRDLALQGAYVIGDATLAPLTECDMFLHVESQAAAPVRLRLRGRVVRADEAGFAVVFTGMTRECYENLKYIMKYNAAIAAQIETESSRHTLELDENPDAASETP